MQDPKKLDVYQDAMALSVDVYKAIEPIQGNFRTKDQLNASLTAVFANLAEMGGFDNPNQMIQKLKVCISECNEAESWMEFLRKVDHITEAQHKDFVNRLKVLRMKLYNLLKSVENKNAAR